MDERTDPLFVIAISKVYPELLENNFRFLTLRFLVLTF